MTEKFNHDLDDTDCRLLRYIQNNADINNQELAAYLHVSPATCLRRVKRLKELGYIEHTVAHLNPSLLIDPLSAIIEINLEIQTEPNYELFEQLTTKQNCVQQCYRVSPGPDFILICYFTNMADYHQFAQGLSRQHPNLRNIKTFFITHRSKFTHRLPI